jgi:hypothetical protein
VRQTPIDFEEESRPGREEATGANGERDHLGVETRRHYTRLRIKLFEPNVWMLGACFNVRAYTVAASTRSAPAATSRRSTHLCNLPFLGCSWLLHTCR